MKAVLITAVLALVPVLASPAPDDEGEIALADAPFCDFLVVVSPKGFALLRWYSGPIVFAEGDRLTGALDTPGLHEFKLENIPALLPDALTFRAEVVHASASLQQVRAAFYQHCRDKPEHGDATRMAQPQGQ